MKNVNRFFLFFIVFLIVACSHTPLGQAEKTAVDFSKAIYTLKLDEAKKYCTPNGAKLIEFIASNLKEEDIDVLKDAGDVKISVIGSTVDPGDSTATVNLKISNYLQINLMGGKSTIEKEKEEKVDLVKVGDKWLVDLHK